MVSDGKKLGFVGYRRRGDEVIERGRSESVSGTWLGSSVSIARCGAGGCLEK